MKNEEIKKVIGLVVTCQSMIHQVDAISDSSIAVREFKRATNKYLNHLEQFVSPITKAMDINESQYYINIVTKIDEIVEEIEVEQLDELN